MGIIENDKTEKLIKYLWSKANYEQKNKVKEAGGYSFYQTIRMAMERGRFSDRMIKAFNNAYENIDCLDIKKFKGEKEVDYDALDEELKEKELIFKKYL